MDHAGRLRCIDIDSDVTHSTIWSRDLELNAVAAEPMPSGIRSRRSSRSGEKERANGSSTRSLVSQLELVPVHTYDAEPYQTFDNGEHLDNETMAD